MNSLYHISPNIKDPNPSQYKSIHYPNHNMGLWLGTLYQDLLYMNNTIKIRFYDIVIRNNLCQCVIHLGQKHFPQSP